MKTAKSLMMARTCGGRTNVKITLHNASYILYSSNMSLSSGTSEYWTAARLERSTLHHKAALAYCSFLCPHHATYYAHECHLNDKT